MKKGNNGYGDAVGKWFGRLKIKFGITDEAKVLHSLNPKRIRIEERRKTEQLYRVEPGGEPLLIDEHIFGDVRTAEELLWAEHRLSELGFQLSQEDSVKSYLRDQGDVVVFADPRGRRELMFRVYKKPLSKKVRRRRGVDFFKLADSWKHKIQEKYKRIFDDIIKTH